MGVWRVVSAVCLVSMISPVGLADAGDEARKSRQEKVQELSDFRHQVQKLEWQKIQVDQLSKHDHCRALLLLNHALDEIGSAAIAEASLVDSFLEKRGVDREKNIALPKDKRLAKTMEDGVKISAALIQGPMSDSDYAREWADVDEDALSAYEHMYANTCSMKWQQFDKGRDALRLGIATIRASKLMDDYLAWVPAENARLQKEYEAEIARQKAELRTQAQERKARGTAQAAEWEEERQQREDSRRAQEALAAAQKPKPKQEQPNTVIVIEDDDEWRHGWYRGLHNRPGHRPWYRDGRYRSKIRGR